MASQSLIILAVGASESETLQRLATALERLGHHVVHAANAQEALRLADQERPDAVLCGSLSPPLDAVELCWAIRKTSRGPLCTFVMFSPGASAELRTRAYRTGVDLVLEREPSSQELDAYLRSQSWLRSTMEVPDLLMAGNLQHLGLLPLLQMVSNLGVTGRLELRTRDGGRGSVGLRKGQIVHAEIGEIRGKEALLRLIDEGASYSLFRETVVRETSIQEPTQQLILDVARRLDERSPQNSAPS